MGGILDGPVRPDGAGDPGGGDGFVCEIACGVGREVSQAGFGITGMDAPLDPDDGRDASVPIWVRDGVCRVEHGDGAGCFAVVPGVAADDMTLRHRARAEAVDLAVQGGLIVLDLDDQADIGVSRGLECFSEKATSKKFLSYSIHLRKLIKN